MRMWLLIAVTVLGLPTVGFADSTNLTGTWSVTAYGCSDKGAAMGEVWMNDWLTLTFSGSQFLSSATVQTVSSSSCSHATSQGHFRVTYGQTVPVLSFSDVTSQVCAGKNADGSVQTFNTYPTAQGYELLLHSNYTIGMVYGKASIIWEYDVDTHSCASGRHRLYFTRIR